MLEFHLVNGLKFSCQDFVTILTNLQSDPPSPNAKPWYIGGNLGHILYKELSHQKACTNILKAAAAPSNRIPSGPTTYLQKQKEADCGTATSNK